MVVERIMENKQRQQKIFPVKSNRASELGHPCLRYLVFLRTRWQDRRLPGPELQLIFDLGEDIESRVIRDLLEAGFHVLEQQRVFEWKEFEIVGHVDCKLLIDGISYPCEIKSVSPIFFKRITDVESLKNSRYVHFRRYPAQLSLYLLMDNKERGLFIFKNKSTGQMKEVWMDLDYEYAESLLKKAEIINKHVRENTYPEPHYDEDVCPNCDFLHICGVSIERNGIEHLEDTDLEEIITRWYELRDYVREFNDLDEILKKELEGKKAIIGNFLVDGFWKTVMRYEVPEDIKKLYQKETKHWVRKIKKI